MMPAKAYWKQHPAQGASRAPPYLEASAPLVGASALGAAAHLHFTL